MDISGKEIEQNMEGLSDLSGSMGSKHDSGCIINENAQLRVADLSHNAGNTAKCQENLAMFAPCPEEPAASDCCGMGCTLCVFDIYEQELAIWESECKKIRLQQETDPFELEEEQATLSPDHYQSLRLVNIEEDAPDTQRYTFALPSAQLSFSVGHHLVMRWRNSTNTVTRQYTPIKCDQNKLVFIIKIYPDALMSSYIRQWQVEEMVEWRGPFGDFKYQVNKFDHVIMFAAGTGIAPMIQVIQHILSNEDDETRIHLVYSCHTYHHILCKAWLDEYSSYWNFSQLYILSQDDGCTSYRYGDKVMVGRLNEDIVAGCINERGGVLQALICGTNSYNKDVLNYLLTSHLSETNIFKF